MAEPTSSGAVGAAIGAGALAGMLAALGIGAQPLFWALVGATLGMSVAPQTSRARACIVFACSVLASALLGTHLAQEFMDDARGAANVAAFVMGALFHPLLGAATNAVPTVIAALLRRFGLGA